MRAGVTLTSGFEGFGEAGIAALLREIICEQVHARCRLLNANTSGCGSRRTTGYTNHQWKPQEDLPRDMSATGQFEAHFLDTAVQAKGKSNPGHLSSSRRCWRGFQTFLQICLANRAARHDVVPRAPTEGGLRRTRKSVS